MSVDSSTTDDKRQPAVPVGSTVHALPPAARRLLRLSVMFWVAVLALVLVATELALRFGADADLPWPTLVPTVAVVACLLAGGLWWVGRVYRSWTYTLEPDRLRVESGVITTRAAVLPRSRVQHVSTERGPVQRWLGLVTLTVHTAGANTPNVSVPNLLQESAEELRRELIGVRR